MEEFLSFIADILEVDKSTLTLETSQDDVETWDSLMQLRLLGEIEAKYGVMIPRECFAAFFHILSFLWIYVAMRSKYQKECKNHERYFPCSSHTILWLKAYS